MTDSALNLVMGVWILGAPPWLLAGHTTVSLWNGVVVGAVLVALSLSRGHIEDQFGGWNRYLDW